MSIEAYSNIKGVSPFCWFPLDFCSPPGLLASGNPSLSNVTFCLFSNLLHLYIYICHFICSYVRHYWRFSCQPEPDQVAGKLLQRGLQTHSRSRSPGLVFDQAGQAEGSCPRLPTNWPPHHTECRLCALPSQPLPCPSMQNANLDVPHLSKSSRGIFVRVIFIERSPFVALLHPNSDNGALWRTCTFPSDGCRPVPQPAMYPSQPTNQPAQPVSQLNPNYLANQNNLFAPVCYLF